MNKILSLAILGLLISLPANAQRSMAAAMGPNGAGPLAGGSGGSGAGAPVGGGGSVAFHTLAPIPPAQFQIVDVSGGSNEFVPSSWTQFENGLAVGRAQLDARRKTLGEVADEYRHAERPKAKFSIIQDAVGNAIIERR